MAKPGAGKRQMKAELDRRGREMERKLKRLGKYLSRLSEKAERKRGAT